MRSWLGRLEVLKLRLKYWCWGVGSNHGFSTNIYVFAHLFDQISRLHPSKLPSTILFVQVVVEADGFIDEFVKGVGAGAGAHAALPTVRSTS